MIAPTHSRHAADDECLRAFALRQFLDPRLRQRLAKAESHTREARGHRCLRHHAHGTRLLEIHPYRVGDRARERRISRAVLELRHEHEVVLREHVVADERAGAPIAHEPARANRAEYDQHRGGGQRPPPASRRSWR
jgi:hypothetical protein